MPEGRVYFERRDGRSASIPQHFTDLGAIDPVVVMGRGQSLFRVRDLLELCSLIDADASAEEERCVKETLPYV